MNNDREFFTDISQRLAGGQVVISYHFPNSFFQADRRSGLMLLRDENGTEYEVGTCFTETLNEYIRQNHLAWSISINGQTLTLIRGSILQPFQTNQAA
jgi:hypothetical protein